MHPAPSVILFTTLSGAGFGLLAFLGLGMPDVQGWVLFVFLLLGFGLATGGLVASTFHLGNPQRALLAFSQWRSSWLSREGCLAVAALLLMALYALLALFGAGANMLLGAIGAVLCLATVFATAMIYTQLKTVPRWNMALTPVLFLSYALAGGALLAAQVNLAIFLLAVTAVVQVATWYRGDQRFAQAGSTVASATGLGGSGDVRAFAPPHTSPNYLMREMVHVVGRRHAQKLRLITMVLAFGLPILALLLPVGHLGAGVAVLSHLAGVACGRWLFFAQAEHVVGLYYGAR